MGSFAHGDGDQYVGQWRHVLELSHPHPHMESNAFEGFCLGLFMQLLGGSIDVRLSDFREFLAGCQ